jgi:hypothetical protein
VTSMLALDHVGKRNLALLAPSRGPTFSGGIFWDMLSRAYSGVWAYTPLKVMFAQLSKRLILPFEALGKNSHCSGKA